MLKRVLGSLALLPLIAAGAWSYESCPNFPGGMCSEGGVVPGLLARVFRDTPAAGENTVRVALSTGPADGLAILFGSNAAVAGIPTMFGSVFIDPAGLFMIGSTPLDSNGGGTLEASYEPAQVPQFFTAVQAVFVSGGGIALTNRATVASNSTDPACVASGTYVTPEKRAYLNVTNSGSNSYETVHVLSGGGEVSLSSFSLSTAVSTALVSNVELDPGDSLELRCNGSAILTLQ